jgi:hypothetical protein
MRSPRDYTLLRKVAISGLGAAGWAGPSGNPRAYIPWRVCLTLHYLWDTFRTVSHPPAVSSVSPVQHPCSTFRVWKPSSHSLRIHCCTSSPHFALKVAPHLCRSQPSHSAHPIESEFISRYVTALRPPCLLVADSIHPLFQSN